jgi:hypothetical protein
MERGLVGVRLLRGTIGMLSLEARFTLRRLLLQLGRIVENEADELDRYCGSEDRRA